MSHGTFLTLLTRFTEKLRMLMLPINPDADADSVDACPLPAEVCAGVALLEWMLARLDQMQEQLGEDRRVWRMLLPNISQLDAVIASLRAIPDPVMSPANPRKSDCGVTITPANPRKSDFESEIPCPNPRRSDFESEIPCPNPRRSDFESKIPCPNLRRSDFVQKKALLCERLSALRPMASGYSHPTQVAKVHFLPKASQRVAYRDFVKEYYQLYMRSGQGMHKDDMLHWAALYQAIVERGGVLKPAKTSATDCLFYGSEFDHFIYDECGIEYNKSKDARGRYRRVGEVREACLHPDPSSPKALSPERRKHFLDYKQNALSLIVNHQSSGSATPHNENELRGWNDVPRPLNP